MQRILQINIAGRIQPIEEDAYVLLKNYISALERQFTGVDGREITEDIENRISELFSIRLQSGSPAIDRADVQKVIDTLGSPSDLGETGGTAKAGTGSFDGGNRGGRRQNQDQYSRERLLRDPFDKVIGGVCSGLAHYFDIDPVIVRLIMVVLFLTAGIGFLTYIIAWCVIPPARTRQELYSGAPVTFHDITQNVAEELQDLKKRGEDMSKELRDFFSKKK